MVFSALFAVNRWFIHRMGIANGLQLPKGGTFATKLDLKN
jgi:hypothetical protein